MFLLLKAEGLVALVVFLTLYNDNRPLCPAVPNACMGSIIRRHGDLMLPTAPALVHRTRSISKGSWVQTKITWKGRERCPWALQRGQEGTKGTARDRGDTGWDPAGACRFYQSLPGAGLSVRTGILTVQHSRPPQRFTKTCCLIWNKFYLVFTISLQSPASSFLYTLDPLERPSTTWEIQCTS